MTRLVTDEMVSEALGYLSGAAEPAAAAKAERIRAEYGRKRVRSRIMLDTDGPVAIREATAEISDEYEQACEREAEAARNDEWHRLQRNKAEAIIEAWRTESATVRSGQNFR